MGPAAVVGVPYEGTVAGKPPINITVAPPPPSSARLGIHPLLRPSTSPDPSLTDSTSRSNLDSDVRRDSGLAPSSSTARESRTTLTDVESSQSFKHSPSLPKMSISGIPSRPRSMKKFRKWSGQKIREAESHDEAHNMPEIPFKGITTDIPTVSFSDMTSPDNLEFSKRGSLLIGGKRANELNGRLRSHGRTNSRLLNPLKHVHSNSSTIPVRAISADDEILSQKVRSMYENGTDEDGNGVSSIGGDTKVEKEATTGSDVEHTQDGPYHSDLTVDTAPVNRVPSRSSRRSSFIKREDHELAGGIEDWQDIKGGDVDRYGFIVPRSSTSPRSSTDSPRPMSPDAPRLHRVATRLQLAADTPRNQRNNGLGRSASTNGSTRSTSSNFKGQPAKDVRPSSSQSSYRPYNGRPASRMRSAANRLPHNRERRCMDEAGDMLTLPPGLADIAEYPGGDKRPNAAKRKEWEREEKWRKMARIVKNPRDGGGMVFDFDMKDPRLVQRAWKGIPDRWRATAWHSFLSASAKKTKGSQSDEELIASFNELLNRSSPDDVQIDIDVPRTINSHIMFRRRYRGGQRLLFRVLHCLSLYFPDTGYVQGMAALAATLLCYFDEEMAFVMLVRMWQLRGLARLYQSGFEGLMEALEEFEKKWLVGGEVAKKLTDLNISPTAYGTRWYLTVFNYSIPFQAQLRVWDVWMLLGDADPGHLPNISPINILPSKDSAATTPTPNKDPSFHGGLDVLHATSAALIDGTREILLDSDFETAMKVLTSWIPIRDEELLMRVTKAEWKLHRRRS